jgi:hypothetical protein
MNRCITETAVPIAVKTNDRSSHRNGYCCSSRQKAHFLELKGEGVCDTSEITLKKYSYGIYEGEVTGECRKLHNEELNDLYCSPNGGARWRSG